MHESLPNIRHLRVFREVARLQSVSAAAEQVHLSQPAVTQAVSKLEAELGAALFERRSDGMYLTPIGSTFLARVAAALDHLETGAREASRVGLRHAGRGFTRFDRLITSAQLRALAALSDASNFSMAARALGVSQPSVHRAARNLEKVTGIELFKSAPEGVSLTHAAQALAQRTKLAFAELKQGFEEIGEHLGRDSSVITVGSLPLARSSIMPRAINAMVAARPNVQIRVVDGVYETLLARLRSGEIDVLIGALRHPLPAEDVTQERLFDDPLTIVAGARHPLAGRRNVSIAETLDWPWVAPPRPTPAGSYLFDTLRIHEREQTPVRVVSSSLALLRGLLTSGDYITIISAHQIRHEIEQGLLVPLDVSLEASSRAIGLTFREGWRPTPAQSLFLDLVREAAREAMGDPA